MRLTRPVAIAAAFVLAACGKDNPVTPSGTSVSVSAGNNQVIAVGAAAPAPLAVVITDANGAPLSGVSPVWAITSGGGTLSAETASDANGIATAVYTAGTTSGPKTVTATLAGVATPATFTVTVNPGPAKRIIKAGGDAQINSPNTPAALPIRVQVVDTFGNGVAGVPVTFAITAGGGSVVPSTANTDASGNAQSAYTSATTGNVTITATSAGLTGSPLAFTMTVNVGATLVKSIPYNTTFVHDQFVRGGILFVAAWERFDIFDVGGGTAGGTAAAPVLIGTGSTNANNVSGGAQIHNIWWYWSPDPLIGKKYMFVGQEGPPSGGIGVGSSGDIHVVDISNPATPVEVAFYHMSGLGAPRDSAGTHNFWVDEANQVLYAAYYNGGVVAINIAGTLTGNLASREIARIRPGGAGNTYIWGVQLYQGSLYATDMISGFWQLKLTGNTFSAVGGGNNVPERYGSDQWVANGFAYSGTWGSRSSAAGVRAGNTLKIWQLNGTGAPVLVDSIVTPNIGTVSDVEVSADNKLLVFSAEGGSGAGIYFYSLVADPAHPVFLGRYSVPAGVHTATLADINGKRYVFAAKDPGGPAELILDVTAISP